PLSENVPVTLAVMSLPFELRFSDVMSARTIPLATTRTEISLPRVESNLGTVTGRAVLLIAWNGSVEVGSGIVVGANACAIRTLGEGMGATLSRQRVSNPSTPRAAARRGAFPWWRRRPRARARRRRTSRGIMARIGVFLSQGVPSVAEQPGRW